jgi:hypothetical protein
MTDLPNETTPETPETPSVVFVVLTHDGKSWGMASAWQTSAYAEVHAADWCENRNHPEACVVRYVPEARLLEVKQAAKEGSEQEPIIVTNWGMEESACAYCGAEQDLGPVKHKPDCAWLALRRLVGG